MRLRPVAISIVLMTLTFAIAACSGAPAPSFDPAGACTGDGSAPGAYPELEALIPTTYEDRGPDHLDSGRNCTPVNLGVLADTGIDEVRFAGGTWSFGGRRAAALAVFEAEGLTADAMADFYATSASSANRTDVTGTTLVTLAGRAGHRLDTRTGDRIQSVMVWPAADTDRVNVVITTDLPDPKIQAAVDAFGGG